MQQFTIGPCSATGIPQAPQVRGASTPEQFTIVVRLQQRLPRADHNDQYQVRQSSAVQETFRDQKNEFTVHQLPLPPYTPVIMV